MSDLGDRHRRRRWGDDDGDLASTTDWTGATTRPHDLDDRRDDWRRLGDRMICQDLMAWKLPDETRVLMTTTNLGNMETYVTWMTRTADVDDDTATWMIGPCLAWTIVSREFGDDNCAT